MGPFSESLFSPDCSLKRPFICHGDTLDKVSYLVKITLLSGGGINVWERSYLLSFRENREMFLRYYWTIAIYFQSNTYYFLSSTVLLHFVFPPFSPSWKKGINDERRLGSHQFSSSTCKEASQYFALLFSSAHSAAEPENGDLILDCSERWMSFVSQQGDDALVTHTHTPS